jgi:hypothetical protein
MNDGRAHAVARALGRAAHWALHRKPGARAGRAGVRHVRRVLLVAAPSVCHDAASHSAWPDGLAAEADSLRAAGFQAEVYDATSGATAASMRAHIEHAYPHVVAVVAGAGVTAEAAAEVSRVAKDVVPNVFTVLLRSPSGSGSGEAPTAVSAYDVAEAAEAEALLGVLSRLAAGEAPLQTQPVIAAA